MHFCRSLKLVTIISICCLIVFSSFYVNAQTTHDSRVLPSITRDTVRTISLLYDTYNELIDHYDTMINSLSRVEKLGSSQSMHGLQSGNVDKFVIEPQISAIEQLVKDMPHVSVRNLNSFLASELTKLGNSERRAHIRSGISDFSAGVANIESGRLLILQYNETSKSIDTIISNLHEMGDKLMPLIALLSIDNLGFLPIKLVSEYPERLNLVVTKLDNRRRKGEEILKVAQSDLSNRLSILSNALNQELLALKVEHEQFLREMDKINILGDEINTLQQQFVFAIDALNKAKLEQERAEAAFRRTEEYVRIALEKFHEAEHQRDHAFRVSKDAFNLCPNKHHYDNCDHQKEKQEWWASSAGSVVEHRSTSVLVEQRRSDLSLHRKESQEAGLNMQREIKNVKQISGERDQYLNALLERNKEYGKAKDQLNNKKFESRIDLLWAANAADRAQLSKLESRL